MELQIQFAFTSFKWLNNAKEVAGVTVVIIGIANQNHNPRILFTDGHTREVEVINAYLLPASEDIFVYSRTRPIAFLPKMNHGNMPADGGRLLFNTIEKKKFIEKEPHSEKWFRRLLTVNDHLNGRERWCLWLEDIHQEALKKLPLVMSVVDEVRKIRMRSSRPELAEVPHLFAQITQPKDENCVIVPRVSSENREYLPNCFINGQIDKVTDSFFTIVIEEPSIFGIVSSLMHMVWVKNVGGKLETRIQYSKNVVYNTFPFPPISDQHKAEITQCVFRILAEREKHPEKTLAQLYDPDKMPEGLREAHRANDIVIEKCYRARPFESDEERLEFLFKLYEKMIEGEKNKGGLFAEKKKSRAIKKK